MARLDEAVPDWAGARRALVLDPGICYLNASAFGPLARSVHGRVAALRQQLAAQPSQFMLRELPALLWHARTRLADYVGAAPHRLLLTTNVSSAISLVASSLLGDGPGEILLTDQEYSTARWCWERAASRLGWELKVVTLPPASHFDPVRILELAKAAMTARTRVFFFSHVLSTTGAVLPVHELCREASRRGITSVVDGAHGPGMLPLALAELDCDFYVSCGHKWLLMPTGSGFLYLGRENERRLVPLTVSWGYRAPGMRDPDERDPDERDPYGSTGRLRHLECEGTRDLCAWLAAPEAIDFHAAYGHAEIYAHMRSLSDYANRRLGTLPGLQPVTPQGPGQYGAITAFRLPDGVPATQLRLALWQHYRIEVSIGEQSGGALLRVSNHFYNSPGDIDLLAQALQALLPGHEAQ